MVITQAESLAPEVTAAFQTDAKAWAKTARAELKVRLRVCIRVCQYVSVCACVFVRARACVRPASQFYRRHSVEKCDPLEFFSKSINQLIN